jgi:antagonist of KipI
VTGPPVPVFHVEEPGLFTTIQDFGRPGRYGAGIPTGGAMDRFALAAANLLVGNVEDAPGLECTMSGPSLRARRPCLVAVTGADFEPLRNGRPVPTWESVFLAEGDLLSFAGRRLGARAYVAVAGGLHADRWLGSAATYLLLRRGGLQGRQLQGGDELALAGEPRRPSVVGRALPASRRPAYGEEVELRAVPGPHSARLGPRGRRAFHGTVWRVSRDSDRMGCRLEGPELDLKIADLISFGLAMGCVQVPPSGHPILLLADHQTAGGYPVVAGVARVDLPLAGQLGPGDGVRFRETTLAEAQDAWRRSELVLEELEGLGTG